MQCPKCGSENVWKNGSSRGIKVYKCKGCNKYFNGKPKHYSEAEKDFAVKLYLNNCGVRKTALFVNCAPSTVLEWVKNKAKDIVDLKFDLEGDVIEMDEIFTKIKKNEIRYEYGRLIRVR